MLNIREHLLPAAEARTQPVRLVVLHAFALSMSEMLTTLAETGLSTHYLIDADGTIIRAVPEEKVAFHAGRGVWRGLSGNLNAMSIGIELYHPTLGQTPYPPAQRKALITLLKDICARYRIPPAYVIGHSDMAPQRKADPGRAFPWAELAAAGVGLWPKSRMKTLSFSLSQAEMLAGIGYDVSSTEALRAAIYAFKRHFVPEKVGLQKDLQKLLQAPCPPRATANSNCPLFLRRLKQVYSLYSVEN